MEEVEAVEACLLVVLEVAVLAVAEAALAEVVLAAERAVVVELVYAPKILPLFSEIKRQKQRTET